MRLTFLTRRQIIIIAAALAIIVLWYARPTPTSPAPQPVAPSAVVPEAPSSATQLPDGGVAAPTGRDSGELDTSSVRRAGQLTIARLGLVAPLMVVGRADEALFQKALESGVVHYPGTASPGQVGNMFIFGHSSDYRYRAGTYKTVFARLPELEPGDRIVVTDAAQMSFTYVVTSNLVAPPTATQYLSQATDGQKRLTLQTSYPIGTALKRYLVLAELEP